MAHCLKQKRRKCVKSPNIFRDKQEYSSLYTISSHSASSVQSIEMTSQITRQNANQNRIYKGQHHKGDVANIPVNRKSEVYESKYPKLPNDISQELQEKFYSNSYKSYYNSRSQFFKNKFDSLTLENHSSDIESKQPYPKPYCPMHISANKYVPHTVQGRSTNHRYLVNSLEESYWATWKPSRCGKMMNPCRNHSDQPPCIQRPRCTTTRIPPEECLNILAQAKHPKSKSYEDKSLKVIRKPAEICESHSNEIGSNEKVEKTKSKHSFPQGGSDSEAPKWLHQTEEDENMDTSQEEYESLYNEVYMEYETQLRNRISEYEMQREEEEMREMEKQFAEQEAIRAKQNEQPHNEQITKSLNSQVREIPEINDNTNHRRDINQIYENEQRNQFIEATTNNYEEQPRNNHEQRAKINEERSQRNTPTNSIEGGRMKAGEQTRTNIKEQSQPDYAPQIGINYRNNINSKEHMQVSTEEHRRNSLREQAVINLKDQERANHREQTRTNFIEHREHARASPTEHRTEYDRVSPRVSPRELNRESPREQIRINFREHARASPTEQPQTNLREQNRATPREQVHISPREYDRVSPRASPKEQIHMSSRDQIRSNTNEEQIHPSPRDQDRINPNNQIHEKSREEDQIILREQSQTNPKEHIPVMPTEENRANSRKQELPNPIDIRELSETERSRSSPTERMQDDNGRQTQVISEEQTHNVIDEWEDYQKMERLSRNIPEKELTPHLPLSIEYSEPEIAILKHTDSFIINSRRQKEDRPRKPQPKFIKLTKTAFIPTVKGHTYPLKPALKKEKPPSQPIIGFSRPFSPNTPKLRSPSKQLVPPYLLRH